ncbi:MAG: hypothetical protein ACXAEF_10440, partial [Candidatus Thorarchaeota archaeon]
MSADREKLEAQFDELKEKTLGYLEELGNLNTETEELRTARREAEEKAWAAEEKITKLGADLEEMNSKVAQLEQDLQDTKTELTSVKEEAAHSTAGKDDEIAAIIQE